MWRKEEGMWNDLKDHQESPIFRKKPWMLYCDFNEVLDGYEHSNGAPTSSGMRDFQDFVRYCSF